MTTNRLLELGFLAAIAAVANVLLFKLAYVGFLILLRGYMPP